MSDERSTLSGTDGGDIELSPDRQQIHELLQRIDDVQRRSVGDVDSVLTEVNAVTVAGVPGAHAAGLSLVDADRAVTTLGATDVYATLLDEIQNEHREGPCLSAAWDDDVLQIDDLTADTRWPRYQRSAIERTPVRSVLSVRLHNDGNRLAALNLYAPSPGVFDGESLEQAMIFAAHTTVTWNLLRREQQFRNALASRDLIGQAKGVLMERFGIDAVRAFELLRRLSQESNTKLVDIAHRVIEAGVGEH
ncbi:MAG: GAF and ANTAR domain-containing protein [Mycobacterium kyogaense]|uniref:GAF and ANTAR domain-containing protein n=1 Tax=Mycobacterium kyogaense TaxID=2212479 RepID=UPI002FFC2FAF